MQVYHGKYQEMLIAGTDAASLYFLSACENLFLELLHPINLSKSQIFQAANLNNYTISNRPIITAPLLQMHTLPSFYFLTCNN